MDLFQPFDLIECPVHSIPELKRKMQAAAGLLRAETIKVNILGQLDFHPKLPGEVRQRIQSYLADDPWQDELAFEWEDERPNSLPVNSIGRKYLEVDLDTVFLGPPWENDGETDHPEFQALVKEFGHTAQVLLPGSGAKAFFFPVWSSQDPEGRRLNQEYEEATSLSELSWLVESLEQAGEMLEWAEVLFGEGTASFEVKGGILADKSLAEEQIEAINQVLLDGYSGLKLLSVGPKWMTLQCEWDGMDFEFRAGPSEKTTLNIE